MCWLPWGDDDVGKKEETLEFFSFDFFVHFEKTFLVFSVTDQSLSLWLSPSSSLAPSFSSASSLWFCTGFSTAVFACSQGPEAQM